MTTPDLSADILIADDEPAIRNGCRRVLSACGARVEIAATGAEALDKLSQQPFDVAIIDLIMPTFGGMELLDRIAEAGINVVPVVITAHASIETAIDAVKRGAFDYLPKPFVPLELTARVERALRWRRLRDEAEQRLLELDTEQSRLRAIVNSLADGVLIVNLQEQVVMANPAACAALQTGGIAGEPQPLTKVVADEKLIGLIREVLGGTSAGGTTTTEGLAEGKVYMARVVPIKSGTGELRGTATVLRDVTELVSLERAKSQFMSMVAHELKNPLAAVQGFLKVILSGQELTPEKLHDIIARCSERAEGMAQLVRDLLDLSRADTMPLRKIESLSLEEVVAEVIEANEHQANALGVSVRTDLPPGLPLLQADRQDMARMLTNLVSNAIKYNVPGGTVTVSGRVQNSYLRIAVQDTGLGIPEDAMARLGQEFFRINLPDRRGIVGTGLGLSLVKRTVEAYHGRLEVQSEVGKGSTFSLVMPMGETKDGHLSPPPSTTPGVA